MRWFSAFILAVGLIGTARAEPVTLNIGVRSDAAPFSYASSGQERINQDALVRGPLYEAGYRGYVVQVCDRALNNLLSASSDIEIVPMEIGTSSRFGDNRANWHVLCDPATMTETRLEEHDPTLPIYLSGISYARVAEIPKGAICQPVVGVADNTTTEHGGIKVVAEAGELPRFRKDLLAAIQVNAPEGVRKSECDDQIVPIVVRHDKHTDLAAALCAGDILYYIGDYEIIRANLTAIPECDYELSHSTYSDERYTIFTRRDGLSVAEAAALMRFRAEVAREVLRRESILLQSYRAYLGGTRPSRKLTAFYWGLIGRFE